MLTLIVLTRCDGDNNGGFVGSRNHGGNDRGNHSGFLAFCDWTVGGVRCLTFGNHGDSSGESQWAVSGVHSFGLGNDSNSSSQRSFSALLFARSYSDNCRS